MTLADAFHVLAATGCRLGPDDTGGIVLTVPEGAVVPVEVLDVLRAHREQLGIAVADARPASDLREYLNTKGISGPAADLVEHAAATFSIKTQSITVQRDDAEPEMLFFEPGIPFRTMADTEWTAANGNGTTIIPGGTLGLVIPQVWAIDDPFERKGIEAILESIKRRKLAPHLPVWLDDHPRVLEIALVDFEHAVATPGMNLLPWRPAHQRRPSPC